MFGVVRFISTLWLGGSGGSLPPAENFWNLEAKRLLLRPFLDHFDAPQRPDRLLISQATTFADEACETIIIRLEERKGAGRVLSHCLQPSRKLQHFTCVFVGVRQAMALIGKAKQARVWQNTTKQATGLGKYGPVETGLTGPVATALLIVI